MFNIRRAKAYDVPLMETIRNMPWPNGEAYYGRKWVFTMRDRNLPVYLNEELYIEYEGLVKI